MSQGQKNRKKNKNGLRMQEQKKPDPYCPSLPHVITVKGFQVLLSSIACLPSYPKGRRYLPYSSPPPVYVPHPISKWPARPLSCSSYPEYKNGLRTHVQCRFSLELACCSNSVSQYNKLYSPLLVPYVWKFFSNLRMDMKGLCTGWALRAHNICLDIRLLVVHNSTGISVLSSKICLFPGV